MSVVFGIVELDTAQVLRVAIAGLRSGQHNGLIAAQPGGLVHGAGVDTAKQQIGFAPDDKERLRLMQGEPASEVGEAAIHDVEAAGFGYQNVEHIDLVHLAVADVDEGWNVAAQVEQRMHLDGSFGGAEMSPRKDAQAQVDGGCVECVDRLLQFDRKAVAGIKPPGGLDQAHRKIHVDTTVALLVGIGQRALGDVSSDNQVIELGLVGAQAGFDIAQALAIGQLREGHAEELIEMRELERWISSWIFGDTLTKRVQW